MNVKLRNRIVKALINKDKKEKAITIKELSKMNYGEAINLIFSAFKILDKKVKCK